MTTSPEDTMNTTPLPKAAARLVEDAKAAGHEVKINTFASTTEVIVRTASGTLVSAYWSETNVAPMNSRLGFATTYKPGVRFDYATAHTAWDTYCPTTGKWTRYPTPRSVRDVRVLLSLEV